MSGFCILTVQKLRNCLYLDFKIILSFLTFIQLKSYNVYGMLIGTENLCKIFQPSILNGSRENHIITNELTGSQSVLQSSFGTKTVLSCPTVKVKVC